MSASPKPPGVWRDEDGLIHGLENLTLCPKCGSSDLWETGAAIQCYDCRWAVDIEYSAPQKPRPPQPTVVQIDRNYKGKYEVLCSICGVYEIPFDGKACVHDGWSPPKIRVKYE